MSELLQVIAALLGVLGLVVFLGILSKAGVNRRAMKWGGGIAASVVVIALAIWLWPFGKPSLSLGGWTTYHSWLPSTTVLMFLAVAIIILVVAKYGSATIQRNIWGLVIVGLFLFSYPTLRDWLTAPTIARATVTTSGSAEQKRTLVAPLGEFSTEAIEIPPACDWDIQVTGAVDKITPSGQMYTIWPKNRSNIGVAPVADVGPCRFRTNEIETKPATVTVTWTPWSQERIAAYWRDHR